jgi:hypothetical protein
MNFLIPKTYKFLKFKEEFPGSKNLQILDIKTNFKVPKMYNFYKFRDEFPGSKNKKNLCKFKYESPGSKSIENTRNETDWGMSCIVVRELYVTDCASTNLANTHPWVTER